MDTLAWIGILLGGVLLVWSLWATLRANAGRRIPMLTNADVVPPGSIVARVVGIAVFVFSSLSLAGRSGVWPAVILFAGALVGLLALASHNRRAAHAGRSGDAA
ncbi:hypothetical protein SAMN05216488_1313 [Microbacterium sp. LKL04]|uniref:Uncharacterized protein n=1 Tax=Microbacterium oleivorans TaxID=273677 RepID=A0A4R5YKF3_9MICO|nr:hypothetical protein [Microbacterium]TDL43897.1 hypothetical protein E2R54_11990 [Microbacterium oleivorans]SCY30844.1 hypothetical protein SAMN05216488_1313 [Microbacterium sp. LKL04]